MVSLSAYFERIVPQVTTIIGSGGKTSLIWRLAQVLARRTRQAHPGSPPCPQSPKILVATTTRMMIPPPHEGLYRYFLNGAEEPGISAPEGITFAGVPQSQEKLGSLPPAQLEGLIPLFDHVLLEGDGSRGLPLKAWADYEPVIPHYTGMTVGLLPLWPLGKVVSPEIIHRLPLFSALSGAVEGEPLSLRHLVPVISGTKGGKGLFSAAQGEKILFINQVEDETAMEQARMLLTLLPQELLAGLRGIAAGSVRQDSLTILWENTAMDMRR